MWLTSLRWRWCKMLFSFSYGKQTGCLDQSANMTRRCNQQYINIKSYIKTFTQNRGIPWKCLGFVAKPKSVPGAEALLFFAYKCQYIPWRKRTLQSIFTGSLTNVAVKLTNTYLCTCNRRVARIIFVIYIFFILESARKNTYSFVSKPTSALE